MSPRDLVYVGHMLDMARKAVSKTQGLPREAYDADENLRLALIHLIQVIGEAARQVSREFSDRHPEIRWSDIIGMPIMQQIGADPGQPSVMAVHNVIVPPAAKPAAKKPAPKKRAAAPKSKARRAGKRR
jgi:hypothetical protein